MLIECDEPVKQMVLFLNEKVMGAHVKDSGLDATHLLVTEKCAKTIEQDVADLIRSVMSSEGASSSAAGGKSSKRARGGEGEA